LGEEEEREWERGREGEKSRGREGERREARGGWRERERGERARVSPFSFSLSLSL